MDELKRIPKGESKSVPPVAGMKDTNRFAVSSGQIPENSQLTQFYASSPEAKESIDTKLQNGGSHEKDGGKAPGINNHTVGHLGTHKI